MEVENPLRIQLKAGHYCLGGSNPAWGILTDEFIWSLFAPAIIVVPLYMLLDCDMYFAMTRSEPLFQEADPFHSKLNMEYEYWYKMVQ